MQNKKIVLAIVSHGQDKLILALLNSLNKLINDIDFEVFLIHNLPPRNQINPNNLGFTITNYKNEVPLGFAENVNNAFEIRGKEADYFCVLNPDVEIPKPIFPTLLKLMEENSIDIISPIVLDHEGNIQDSFRSIPTPISIIKRRISPPTKIVPNDLPEIIYSDWIAGLFMFMTSAVFAQIGGFNEEYKLYFEDVEFCLRAQLQGYKIAVVKEVSILHDAQRKSHENIQYLFYHVSSAIRFFCSRLYRKYRKSLRST